MNSTVLATLLLVSAGCFQPNSGLAQVSPPAPAEPRILYVAPDHMPELPRGGGLRALTAAVQRNLRYPVAAQRQGAQGLVDVAFTVLDDGRIINPYAHGVDYGCPEAAIAAVLQLSPLKPGRQRGVPVPVRMKVTVQFVLDGPMGQNLTPEGQPSTSAPGTVSPKTVPPTPGDTMRVYDISVDRGPTLPDSNGFYAVGRLVQQRLVLPPDVRAGRITFRYRYPSR